MSNHHRISLALFAMIALPFSAEFAKGECMRAQPAPGFTPSTGPALQLYGTVREANGNNVVITTRSGSEVTVDASVAINAQLSAVLAPGQTVEIVGTEGPKGEVRADMIRRARGAPSSWPQDCIPTR